MAQAKRSEGVVELVPQIGDFVAVDDPLFYLYGGAYPVDEDRLRSSVAFGSERSMDQDPPLHFALSSTLR
jgi:Predicted membrane protein